jgi:hypothetical protein
MKELIRDFVAEVVSKSRTSNPDASSTESPLFSRREVLSWFSERYPRIRPAGVGADLILLSTNARSRVHYNVHPDGSDDLLYQIDEHRFRLYRNGLDPAPIYKGDPAEVDVEAEEPTEGKEFAYEEDLKNYLSKNLSSIEPGLKLYEDGDGIRGIEYPAGGRRIDILAVDSANDLVVIELKVSAGYDRVVGQILRYMAWIGNNLAEPNQKVRGIIVAKEIGPDITLAASMVPGIDLYEYELMVKVSKKA